MTETEQQQPPPPQNGISGAAADEDESSRARPADIEQDLREMDRRKRVGAVMSAREFREELERIVDEARSGGGGGTTGLLQQLSDMVGMPMASVGNVFRNTNCVMPINDIRGIDSFGYDKGEKILRCKLAAAFRLLDLFGWTQGLNAHITARLKVDQEYFLTNPYGLLSHEVTASSLIKIDMQGNIVEKGTTNCGVNKNQFKVHSVVHATRPDIRCAIFIGCTPVVAVSAIKSGLLPLTRDACVLGEVTSYAYTGLLDEDECNKLQRSLGPNSKVVLLSNHGALCCGETIDEAFFAACHLVQACETQLKVMPVGIENLTLISEEARRTFYQQARRPPEELAHKFAATAAVEENKDEEPATANTDAAPATVEAVNVNLKPVTGKKPAWRVGGYEFEALMRMLDNAGYRTGYVYRHPLVKSDLPKPKNDVELPPAVSSLGYLLEEEENYRQNIWKKGIFGKGGDRTRWLNSPNSYQKVEVLETGTPDPKKITKWVAEGSPTHSTPVRIEDPLQFVPAGTNPKEFKRLQQQIKDNRRADKISAGPQSHVLEGVTWDEASRIKDANVSQGGDQVVLVGAASKGIIQRGFQHHANVYKAPYAKNPFDNVTEDELNEYKRTVERKKKSIHGEYTDTDFSESEALTVSGQNRKHIICQSEPETELQVSRVETQQAPVPSQAEVVLSDAEANTEELHAFKLELRLHAHKSQTHIVNTNTHLRKKYAFLYEQPVLHQQHHHQQKHLLVYVIQKIETLSNYTYPCINSSNSNNNSNAVVDDSGIIANVSSMRLPNNTAGSTSCSLIKPYVTAPDCALPPEPPATPAGSERGRPRARSTPLSTTCAVEYANSSSTSSRNVVVRRRRKVTPYRTVSHYGFNYPSNYLPTIELYPPNLVTAVELQRRKVIAYINSSALSFAKRYLHNKSRIAELRAKSQQNISNNDEHDDDDDNEEPEDYNEFAVRPPLALPAKCAEQRAASDPGAGLRHVDSIVSRSCSQCTDSSAMASPGNTSTSEVVITSTPFVPIRSQSPLKVNNWSQTVSSPITPNAVDKLSKQFASMLSLSEHASTQTQVSAAIGSGTNEIDESPPQIPTPVRTTSLRRSYVLRNFMPIEQASLLYEQQGTKRRTSSRASSLLTAEEGDEYAQHSRAATASKAKQTATVIGKQFKLTLSTDDDKRSVSAAFSEDVGSPPTHKNIEIHLNVAVKNNDEFDSGKALVLHEHDFRGKLQKLIDDEIQLINQQLSVQQREQRSKARRQRQRCGEPKTSSEEQAHYKQTLALLEQELENLLNYIIRSNELHKQALICDCKARIIKLQDGLRRRDTVATGGNERTQKSRAATRRNSGAYVNMGS